MIIKSCEIGSFGKLSDKTIVLDEKITIIRGKNESGKTTLSTFIKYILYGYMGKGRDASNNEKIKYSLKDGSQSFGALVLESEDKSIYRAERRGDGKSGSSRLIDSRGASCFEGTDIGEALYGTDAVTFSKSVFVGQEDIQGSGMRDIGSSLEKVLLDSEENEDFDGIRRELVTERNALYNRMRATGLIFELCARLDELNEQKKKNENYGVRLVSSRHLATETERKIQENCQRLEELYSELENINAYTAHEQLEKIRDAQKRVRDSEAYCDEVFKASERGRIIPDRAFVDDLEAAISEYSLYEKETEKARLALKMAKEGYEHVLRERIMDGNKEIPVMEMELAEASKKLSLAKEISAKIKKYKSLAILFLCLILTFPLSIAMLVLSRREKKKLSELLERCGVNDISELSECVEKMPGMLEAEKREREKISLCERELSDKERDFSDAHKKLYGHLDMIGISAVNGEPCEYLLKKLVPELKSCVASCEKARAAYLADKSALDALMSVSNVAELEAAECKMRENPPERKKDVVEKAIRYDEGANALLSKKLSDLRTEIAGLEAQNINPTELEAEICKVSAELSEAKLRLDAAELAIELVDESRAALRTGVLPRVSELAGELFSRFTGEKYRSLFFDKDFGLRVLPKDGTETLDASVLSSGTADAAYIALRIALARVLFKEKPTFIFDDSFVRCDDERLSHILGVLTTLSDEYQIIILTCQEREEKMLAGKCRTVVLD